uniref:Uncharacterized protein n=1 Tax=Rhizophora mucronata TaxID=61149 RepID=A0A2P2NZY2_RHIMU
MCREDLFIKSAPEVWEAHVRPQPTKSHYMPQSLWKTFCTKLSFLFYEGQALVCNGKVTLL